MLAYHKVNNINAKVGIYLRISLEDGDKQESNSIDNQRKLIYEYLHKNNFVNIVEFIDDGATGTNFNRKGFKDLLKNIENGNINTVITKDVSRIGRNYVKTGYYIEDYFVNKGVRYISILDEIDTYNDEYYGYYDMYVVKNLKIIKNTMTYSSDYHFYKINQFFNLLRKYFY